MRLQRSGATVMRIVKRVGIVNIMRIVRTFRLPIHPLCVVAWNTAHGRAHADVFTSLTAYEVPLLLLYCLCRCGGFRACVRAFACAHTRVRTRVCTLRVRVCVCVHVRMNLSQWLAQRDPPFISSNAVGWSRTRHYQHGTCTHTPTISLPAYGTPGRNARPSLLHRVARESGAFIRVRAFVKADERDSEADCCASAAHALQAAAIRRRLRCGPRCTRTSRHAQMLKPWCRNVVNL